MKDELLTLYQYHAWLLVPWPINANQVGSKSICKTKHKEDGSIDRFKPYFVAKRFTQIFSVDFAETCSPATRLVIALVVRSHWVIKQLHAQNTFLHGH